MATGLCLSFHFADFMGLGWALLEKILIVSGDKKGRVELSGFLCFFDGSIAFAGSASEAREFVRTDCYDFIFICRPVSDESAEQLAVAFSRETNASVVLLVEGREAEATAAQVQSAGVFVVPRPVDRLFFQQAVQILSLMRSKLAGLSSENSKLQTKIEEIRLVNRAKCVLIQYLNMTEKQAHRYIEKQAMDMRTSKIEVAQGILKTYEY